MSKAVNNNYRSNFVQATFNGNLPFAPRLTSFQTKNKKTVHIVYFRVLSDDYYNGYQTTTSMECMAFGQHALDIAKNFKKGDFVEATSTIDTYSTKSIQGKSLKYPVTITRFNVYKLVNLRKHAKKQAKKPSQKTTDRKQGKQPKALKPKKPAKKADKKLDIDSDDLPF